MRQPDFLLIGAQKAGTSWLSAMLRQHPDVFIPPDKEIHFFNEKKNYRLGLDWYLRHFEDNGGAAAVGECTPNYLWVGDIPDYVRQRFRIDFAVYPQLRSDIHERVHEHFPDARLLVSLRNPVDRAISSYYHAILHRKFSPRRRILDAGGREGIIAMGFYHEELASWMKLFPLEQIRILVYEEDILKDKQKTIRGLYRFLGVDEAFQPRHIERPVNRRPSQFFMHANYYSPFAAKALRRAIPALERIHAIPIRPRDREGLMQIYDEEISRLEDLLGRSFDMWRT